MCIRSNLCIFLGFIISILYFTACNQSTMQNIGKECEITLCLAGAVDQSEASNQDLMDICNHEQMKGVLQDCETDDCFSAWDSFYPTSYYLTSAYPALFSALDNNQDGRVDSEDSQCEITLIGYSWGGVNAVQIAQEIAKDNRIGNNQKNIKLLITIDPFQPGKKEAMKIPNNVKKYIGLRHSETVDYDCANNLFLGYPAKCLLDTDCTDYDFSLAKNTLFPIGLNASEGFLKAKNIGHCEMPSASHDIIISLINNQEYEGPLPPTTEVSEY